VRGETVPPFPVETNLPPTISGVSGPTKLGANQTGTWTVNANDPENSVLSYSVVWGDESLAEALTAPVPPAGSVSSQAVSTATFSHSYSRSGTYTPTFTVRDNAAQEAKTSLSVYVGSGTVVDTTPPVVSIASPAHNETVSADGFMVSARVEDNESQISYARISVWDYGRQQWTVNEANMNNAPDSGANMWNYYINQDKFTIGQQLFIRVRAYNTAGLGSYDQRTVRVGTQVRPQNITVLSPNGGETWEVGKPYNITFSMTNWVSGKALVYLDKYHPLDSEKTGINSSMLIGEIVTDGKGLFSYTVPQSIVTWPGLGSLYKIRVCNATCSSSDSGDNFFSIITSANTATTTQSSAQTSLYTANTLQSIKSALDGIQRVLNSLR